MENEESSKQEEKTTNKMKKKKKKKKRKLEISEQQQDEVYISELIQLTSMLGFSLFFQCCLEVRNNNQMN